MPSGVRTATDVAKRLRVRMVTEPSGLGCAPSTECGSWCRPSATAARTSSVTGAGPPAAVPDDVRPTREAAPFPPVCAAAGTTPARASAASPAPVPEDVLSPAVVCAAFPAPGVDAAPSPVLAAAPLSAASTEAVLLPAVPAAAAVPDTALPSATGVDSARTAPSGRAAGRAASAASCDTGAVPGARSEAAWGSEGRGCSVVTKSSVLDGVDGLSWFSLFTVRERACSSERTTASAGTRTQSGRLRSS